jgi:hypothetical protein
VLVIMLTTSPRDRAPPSFHLEVSKVPRSMNTCEAKEDDAVLRFGTMTGLKRGAGHWFIEIEELGETVKTYVDESTHVTFELVEFAFGPHPPEIAIRVCVT